MQTQPSDFSIFGALVEVMESQAIQTGQIVDVIWLPRVVRQISKASFRRSQRIVSQRQRRGLFLGGSLCLKKRLQQRSGWLGQHPTTVLRVVV